MENGTSKFAIVSGGFQMTFDNGLTISVMFRGGSYCEHKMERPTIAMANLEVDGIHSSVDAEIGSWDEAGTWLDFGGDTVQGYVTTNEVASWIAKITSCKNLADLQRKVA
jgi:hypothetical protein